MINLGKKLMIVEDEIIIAEDIQMIMSGLGYTQTEIVMYAEQSVEMVREFLPDLILMDVFLKGDMSGIEAAKRIRNEYSIPIIFVTAYSDTNSVREITETSPYGYLIKPIKEEELKITVEIAEHKHKIEEELRENEFYCKQIVNLFPNGVLIINDNRIVFANERSETIFKSSYKDEIIGKNINNLIELQSHIDIELDTLKNNPNNQIIKNDITLKLLNGEHTKKDIIFRYFKYLDKSSILAFINA
jgi:CheY-like chemotaxis protein